MGYNTANHNQDSGSGPSIYQDLMIPGSLLTVVKPNSNSRTVVRIYPEHGPDGAPLPMVLKTQPSRDGQSLDFEFSNMYVRPIVIKGGNIQSFTGFANPKHNANPATDPVDIAALGDFTMPWRALYPIWVGRKNKGELNDEEQKLLATLLTKPANSGAPLGQVQDQALVQCAVLVENGTTLPQPKLNCAILLTKTGLDALIRTMKQAHQAKIDLFDFQTGYTLEIKGAGKRGEKYTDFSVEMLQPYPIPPATYWVPYEDQVREFTYDEHINLMVKAYGARVVAKIAPFAEAMSRLGIAVPAAPVQGFTPQVAAPTQAPVQAPAAQTGGWAAPTPTAQQPWTPPAQTTAPAQPAASGWPATAAAPQPANSWAKPATAVATPPANPVVTAPTVVPTTTPAVPTPASANDVQAEYERAIASALNQPKK